MRLLFLFLLLPFIGATQLTYYIRSDSVNMMKQGGNNELILQNGSRAVKGALVNIGNGRTRFISNRTSGDTLFIGLDTLIGIGAAGWKLTGNTGTTPSTNFLGTIDSVGFALRVKNIRAGYIGADGRSIALGTNSLMQNPNSFGTIAIGDSTLHDFTYTSAGSEFPSDIVIGSKSLVHYTGAGGGSAMGGNTIIGAFIGWRPNIVTSRRNTFVGNYSAQNLLNSPENTGVGVFTMEWLSTGLGVNTAVGSNAMRGNTSGYYNTAVGGYAMVYGGGGISSITVTNGGSGYTSPPTVILAAPDNLPQNSPYTPVQATATAVLTGDVVTSITVTNPGTRYSSGSTSVSFSGGGGSGAAATAVVSNSIENTAVGQGALAFLNYGSYNTAIGRHAGTGNGSAEASNIDDLMTFVGYKATRANAIANTTKLTNSTAIGANAKVSISNAIILGDTITQTNVGIGTTMPDRMLDVNGQGIFRGVLTANTSGTPIPTLSISPLDLSPLKVGAELATSNDAAISIYKARAGNFGGGALNFYRTNSSSLSTKAAVLSVQSIYQIVGYGVAGDNSTVDLCGFQRMRANGTPKSTYVPTFWEVVLRDTLGTQNTNLRVYPYGTIIGENVSTPAVDVSAQLEVRTTLRGFLPPRLTTTQQNAIVSPATGLVIYNTDSAALCHYNGSAWRMVDAPTTTVASTSNTPAVTGITNVDNVSASQFHWIRVGNVVSYSGFVNIDATAAGVATSVEVTLAYSSNFANNNDAAGVVTEGVSGATQSSGYIYSNSTSDKIVINVTPQGTAAQGYYVSGSYKII